MSVVADENAEQEFIIPTRYRVKIGAHLSWPTGAMELTKALLHVPQIKDLELDFSEPHPKFPKGKWPVSFSIIETQYSQSFNPNVLEESDWRLSVCAVPRNMRAEIRKLLIPDGLKTIGAWLVDNAVLSGTQSYKRYSCIWNSESKELSFESWNNILPEVTIEKGKGKK